MCTTFAAAKKGLACQKPTAATQPTTDPMGLDSEIGDLKDIRNRLGLLCPMSLRFINMDLQPTASTQIKARCDVMVFTVNLFNKRTIETRPYFHDPYKRDTPNRLSQLMISCHCPSPSGEKRHRSHSFARQITNPRLQLLHCVMEDTAHRREIERKKDALMWCQTGATQFKSLGRTHTSPHLYQPKNVQNKRVFIKQEELSRAASRKRDKEDAIVRKQEKHKNHGAMIRIQKSEIDARHIEELKASISEKEGRHANVTAHRFKQ